MYGTVTGSSTHREAPGRGSSFAPPAAVTQAQSAPSAFRYEVQEGDTLARVAAKLSTTEDKLLALNPILASTSSKKHRVKIYPGQQLVVEEASRVSLPPPPDCIDNGWGQMHVVRSGESIAGIAAMYNTTEELIRQDNRQYFPVGERGILFPGQMLHIRLVNTGETEPETETESEEAVGMYMAASSTVTKYKTHLVEPRDTFESVCKAYNITYARLLQINRGRYPVGARAELVVGERIIVPDHYASQREANRRNIGEVRLTKQIHEVEHGETPESIAEKYQMTYEELREFNRAYFPKGYRGEIHPGYKLVVKRVNRDDYDAVDDDDREL
ncbi:TPA: hypothetical protein N0F65_000676 [Lagenidium giganteum]|uniref:LysM domain-containing protein n=1 Tax=Lagenidium giganteum TaxID=4803 RepID=A0AAV2YUK3_9STRA|nr:TPA: hypothetical protein N0F65_000676 [Lagenidium giganteum]